jgi:hypothetical protein
MDGAVLGKDRFGGIAAEGPEIAEGTLRSSIPVKRPDTF